ncbi:cupin domain-containing protein [Neorhizobium sp. DAR64861/K0K2]|uniref:cupin domain-containing protein n=1 Tax=unclassified Neorhizobium TaxID=2629175 RepID=UPI003D2C515A
MSNLKHRIGAIDILGPLMEFKTEFLPDAGSYCLSTSIIPAGVAVPLHSHPSRETFYITSGILEVFDGNEWQALGAGDVFDVMPDVRNALRNTSAHQVSTVHVTTMALASFYSSVGRSYPAGPPQPQDLEAFGAAAAEHGVWLGSAQDNAAIGISMFTQMAPKMKRPANMTH